MLRHTVDSGDVWKVDFRTGCVGKLDLGLLRSLLETLESHRILLEVNSAIVGSELTGKPFDDGVVEVVTSKVGVSVGGLDFEYTVAKLKYGDIEGTAAEIVYGNLHILVLLVKTIGERRCGRLVDDTLHFQTCNLAGFLGSLALGV